jgi:hypothetical protein
MTNPNDAISATTAALIAATERRLAESREIKSPAELGITADRSIRRSRAPRRTRRRTIR